MQAVMRALMAVVLLALAMPAHADEAAVARGDYLAKAGDCTACHTAPGGKPFAGGLAVHAPIGTIYSTNITPDPVHGIGAYTEADFDRALRRGIAKDGHYLYPAMPYPSYAELTDRDVADLYAYFMQDVQPVAETPTPTRLIFPFNQRWGIVFWNLAFAQTKVFKDNPQQDAVWNRGAYLANALGHCGACHTPRTLFYNEEGYHETSRRYLTGETLDYWYAPDLRGDKDGGLANWSESDIASFLETGAAHNVNVFGGMTLVIEDSTQYMSDADRQALAHYLKSIRGAGPSAGVAFRSQSDLTRERPGAGLYAQFCASCHGQDGMGRAPRYPALAQNPAVLTPDATSLIRIVLEGGETAQTRRGPKPSKMPAFEEKFSAQDVADVVSYIRNAWGNQAPSVPVRSVESLKKALAKKD